MSASRLRWFLKKSARRTFALTHRAGAVYRRVQPHPSVRVLTYHRFGDAVRDPFCVRVEDFDRQMTLLAELGVAVSLAEVESFLNGGSALVDGAVLVTVDDGCPSFVRHALPILQRHRIPAALFVPAGEVTEGGARRHASPPEQPSDRMTWDELEEAAHAGVSIGSHAWTHESLGRMSLDAARTQAARSRERLEERLGRPVTALAYPFGTRADFSPQVAGVVRSVGYTCAFTSQHGAVLRDSDRYMLPRVKVEGGESLWMFSASVHGALDGWHWVDRALWKLQAADAHQ